ncbi:Glycosyl transferase family 2 [bacterium A37T11]|nr:Glycosyl transferase family 2 [bacterium A37T11]
MDYSLIVCTYNPDERLLNRCLKAIAKLDLEGLKTEVILVDNNSTQPLNTLPYVLSYLNLITNARYIIVKEQGLSYARKAGIEVSRGKHTVFFDDDNEPDPNYLQVLKRLHEGYPHVGAWGPGNVAVEFIDGVDTELETYAREAFQERHEENLVYANIRKSQSIYPNGTGLCIKHELLLEYIARISDGTYTLTGRKGRQLTSGEDTQMILLCIELGYAAGVAPNLKVIHIIPSKRANYNYLKRHAYGGIRDYALSVCQVFPEQRDIMARDLLSPSKFFRRSLKKFIRSNLGKSKLKTLETIFYMSLNMGIYDISGKPIPKFAYHFLCYLGLKKI